MTGKQKTHKENLGTQQKETSPPDKQVEKNMTENEKKIAFYKGVQAMRREIRRQQ